MTLYDLLKQARDIEYRLTSTVIPIKLHGRECELKLELKSEGDKQWVEIRIYRKRVSTQELKEVLGGLATMDAVEIGINTETFKEKDAIDQAYTNMMLNNGHPEQNIPITDQQERESKKW